MGGALFKYNFCFSSTIEETDATAIIKYLNTTFVSLQLSNKAVLILP